MNITKPHKKTNELLYMNCPFCNSFNIENDYVHAEYYCKDCGLVISTNNSVKRLTIANFKPKPKPKEEIEKEQYNKIIDILVLSLNINKLY